MSVLFVSSNHDVATGQMHTALLKTDSRESASKICGNLIELYGPRATCTDVKTAWSGIAPENFRLISGMGHGNKDTFTGNQCQVVFKMGNSAVEVCQLAIVHLLSCNCGQRLGRQLVASPNPARAFIGYNNYVLLPTDPSLTEHFVSETAAIDLAIMKGSTKEKTKSAAKTAHDAARKRLLASPSATPSDLAALDSNHDAVVAPWTDSAYGNF